MPSHPIDVYVGKRLRAQRTAAGMSQEALGRAIGITFQQIQKYERGVNRISASRLYEFAHALSVSISYFFEGFEEANEKGKHTAHYPGSLHEAATPDFEHEQLTSRESLEMMRAFNKISNRKLRKGFSDMIKAAAE